MHGSAVGDVSAGCESPRRNLDGTGTPAGEVPRQWIAQASGGTPAELSTYRDQENRREFLRDRLEDPGAPS